MNSVQSLQLLDRARVRKAKQSFATRRVPPERLAVLIENDVEPTPGDLVLVRVDRIGHHSKLELREGRRAQLYVGDELIACYGNRYAIDQFEALVGEDLSPCHLVAAGGIVGTVRVAHDRARRPTRVTPLGRLADRSGQRLNLRDFALPACGAQPSVPTLAIMGTSMNSGKTTVAAHLIKGLERAGYAVGAAKVTGTGAGGDVWQMIDAGASEALDFTDAGYASTYMLSPRQIEDTYTTLVGHLTLREVDIAVVELADGLFQKETMALLASTRLQDSVNAIVFAAVDPVGAIAGVQWLTAQSLPVVAVSGLFTQSPLGMREVESWTTIPVLPTSSLSDPSVGGRLWRDLVAGNKVRAVPPGLGSEGVIARLPAQHALTAT